jgi:hypothetical protein
VGTTGPVPLCVVSVCMCIYVCVCVCVQVRAIATIQISVNDSPHVSVAFIASNTSFSLPIFNEEAGNYFQYELS